jgi:hypothetical protein
VLFSRHFGLDYSQAELDFVDIELTQDQALFVDPYALQVRADRWSVDCTQSIRVYFQKLIDAIRVGDDALALRLLSSLHEPRETRLGLSRAHFRGNAIGADLAREVLAALKASRAVQTGFLRDLSDAELFIPGIGHDRISDLTTGLIRRQLIEYTQQQCGFHGIALVGSVASGPIWDVELEEWTGEHVALPVADGEKILLVPKMAVRWSTLLTPADYYNNFVLNFLQARELEHPALGLIKTLKDGRRSVTKKGLKAHFPYSKEFLLQFSEQNPRVLEEYKRLKAQSEPTLTGDASETFDERAFAGAMIRNLEAIPTGGETATQYHRFMKGALEFLFYPGLSQPRIEAEINEGRKRIDILFLNTDRSGFFHRFPNVTRRPATEIIVECKNYSRDLGNPEVDQIAGRFADHRGWLGLLICRRNEAPEQLLARCRDTARERRGYILPLDDVAIIAMLRLVETGHRDQVTGHLDLLLRELAR